MNTTKNNYEVVIIRKKIKNTYIRVKNNQIVVTTNYLTPKLYIDKLIKDNTKAISKMIEKDKIKRDKENNFYLFGETYDVIYDENIKNTIIRDKKIITKSKSSLDVYLDSLIKEVFSKQLIFWYKKFEENIPLPNLKIRKMTSRWGVCNTKNNNVTINYYLYKYDSDCLDYVIVHELAHFLEGNHSSNFWRVVCKYYPNYKEVRKKLRS